MNMACPRRLENVTSCDPGAARLSRRSAPPSGFSSLPKVFPLASHQETSLPKETSLPQVFPLASHQETSLPKETSLPQAFPLAQH